MGNSQHQRQPYPTDSAGTKFNPTTSVSIARTGSTDPGRIQKEKAQKVEREIDNHEIDDGQIQGYVVNDDYEDEEIDEDKTPQYQVNVRVQNSQRDRGHGMSL